MELLDYTKPKIYVVCTKAYKAGYEHGVWLDATASLETLQQAVDHMLANSPIPGATEWEIRKSPGLGSAIYSYESLERVQKKALLLQQYGYPAMAILERCFGDLQWAQTLFSDHYEGTYESEYHFACQLFNRLYLKSSEGVKPYIHYDAFTSDIFDKEYTAVYHRGKTHIFRSADLVEFCRELGPDPNDLF